MKKRIVVEHNPMETRVALLEDGELVELHLERRGQERLVGNIYKGIVQNVLPGMQAAFVDIGLEKNAFLYAKDIQLGNSDLEYSEEDDDLRKCDIKDLIKPGQEIMVQVFKEPGGTKGTRVTTNITLPGRMLVLMPTVNYIGVSRRIEDDEERERLKSILSEVTEGGFGIIARTSAMGKNKEDFLEEFEFLKRLWNKLFEKNQMLSAPRLIHNEESLVYRTVRDMLSDDIDELIFDDVHSYDKASVLAEMIASPMSSKVIHFNNKEGNIFDYYGITHQIESALTRKVWLKSGGYIIIDHTEALTVVDVNTGKFVGNIDFCETALKTNLEAAVEVAKQIRLRNISGIIVVDFIDMLTEEDRQQVLDILKRNLEKDKTKSAVVGMSDLGLVEITRKKERKSIVGILKQDCPHCGGSGKIKNSQSVILDIYKKVEKLLRVNHSITLAITLHEEVAKAFNDYTKELFMDIDGIGTSKIFLCPVKGIHHERFEIALVTSTKEFENGKFIAFIG